MSLVAACASVGQPVGPVVRPRGATCESYVEATPEHVQAWHLNLDTMEIWSPWFGAPPRRGDRYVVVDDAGFGGVLEVGDRVPPPQVVYDGPFPASWHARFVEAPRRGLDAQIVLAVGPTRERWTGIRRTFPLPVPPPPDGMIGLISDSSPPLPWPTPWMPVFRIDLDGDGEPDLEEHVRHCDEPWVATEWSRRGAHGWTTTARDVERVEY